LTFKISKYSGLSKSFNFNLNIIGMYQYVPCIVYSISLKISSIEKFGVGTESKLN